MNRIDGIHLINDAREAICLAGSTLFDLEERLAPQGREPHSVIGSSAIGASVVGGIANNSGGSQIRKGPAFTAQALYARVNAQGALELINHLGIKLDQDPIAMLEAVERGSWKASEVSPPPPDRIETEYAAHVREIADTPARFNADPKFLFDASGCAGKLMVFAVRIHTFPLIAQTTTFYIATNQPTVLEALRRALLRSSEPLPISGEYLGREAFDLAQTYGKDTYIVLKYAGSRWIRRLFAFKSWVNAIGAKVPLLGSNFADVVSQWIFGILPCQVPRRIRQYRDRYAHHLILVVDHDDQESMERILQGFFSHSGHDGEYFACNDGEAKGAMLHRFGAASAVTRYHLLHRKRVGGMITFDVALRRDEMDWVEHLPADIAEQLIVSAYYGHFFCHVFHQDHVVKPGVDVVALKERMLHLLHARGAMVPAEHNYGRLYELPPELEAHYRELDPCNVMNPGLGGSSPRKGWETVQATGEGTV